jgi:peptide/nickel transport system ATP-binding protein
MSTARDTNGQTIALDARPLLAVDGVECRFTRRLDVAQKLVNLVGGQFREQTVHAVDRVDFRIDEGEVVGLVGESGCGKSTLARTIAGLLEPTAGTIRYRGRPLAGEASQPLDIQMVFQDPMASLNPRLRIRTQLGEAPVAHGLITRNEVDAYVSRLLEDVGLDPDYAQRFPHEFSGGQRQRIAIARALALKPRLLICDEPVAALDVSIQAQVINLFMRLRERHRLTYLFISHDLSVVRHISDRVLIMYLGRIVESGRAEALFESPNHPYTQALLASVPRIGGAARTTFGRVQGEIPSPLAPPSGCHFHPRCPYATERCRRETPALREVAPGRRAACHLNDEAGR